MGTCWGGEGGLEQEDNVTMGLATGHQMAIVMMYMDNSHDTNHVSSVGLHRKKEIIKKLKMQNMR